MDANTGSKPKPKPKKKFKAEVTGPSPKRRLFYFFDMYADSNTPLETQWVDSFADAAQAWLEPAWFILYPLKGTGEWSGDWLRDLRSLQPGRKPVLLAMTNHHGQYEIGLANWPQSCPPTHAEFWRSLTEAERELRDRQWRLIRANWTTKAPEPSYAAR